MRWRRAECDRRRGSSRGYGQLVIGWEVYTAASEVDQEAGIDDIVIGATRGGCPAP